MDWDSYFMKMAQHVATRATCDRKHVGAVVVADDRTILASGYNGAPRGLPECDDVGHHLKNLGGRDSCIRTIHAEANAIINAARTGVSLVGGTLYVTCSPCYECAKLIVNVGIKTVYSGEHYESRFTEETNALLKLASINLFSMQEVSVGMLVVSENGDSGSEG